MKNEVKWIGSQGKEFTYAVETGIRTETIHHNADGIEFDAEKSVAFVDCTFTADGKTFKASMPYVRGGVYIIDIKGNGINAKAGVTPEVAAMANYEYQTSEKFAREAERAAINAEMDAQDKLLKSMEYDG